MIRTGITLLLFLLSLLPFSTAAQPDTPEKATTMLKEEQAIFLDYIDFIPVDSNVMNRLSVFLEAEVDSLHHYVMTHTALHDSGKIRAIYSMVYFMRELSAYLALQKFEIYDIPNAVETYKRLLVALLEKREYEYLLKPLGPRRCRLLAAAFWQYPASANLDDIATYKRVASSPAHILQFLESRPGFRFADSLVVVAAAHDPYKLVTYLDIHPSGFSDSIRKNKNSYVQQIVSLAAHRNISELLPFIVPLAEKKITITEITESRRHATAYFQLLVNTLMKEKGKYADSAFSLIHPLRAAVRNASLDFYVNEINELHNSPYAVRFASIKDLRMEDLYYIITSCEEELYTSSYLGLYRQFTKYFSSSPADSVFGVVGFDNFRQFMRMAANYNTLGDFLSCMPPEKTEVLLKRMISGIESDTHTGLEYAMDVADAFSGFDAVPGIRRQIRDELQSNLQRCRSGELYFGIRLYTILTEVFDMVKQDNIDNKLWTTLGNHEVLKRKTLQNKKREIVEMVLFYGDEDGKDSYNNFMGLFKDRSKWVITENEYWVTIRSVSSEPVVIYANLPLDNDAELDLLAQDSLSAFLKRQQAEPVILFHRGHSYHLGHTLKKLQPSVKLTILGSCGGHNNILSIANISKEAQIIVSKKTGSKFINDPMFEVINQALLNKKDLVWLDIWEKLRIRFSKNQFALNLFNEYIPPGKNVSLFVYKLFNYYR